jgi:alpha-D-xyloside xylohydrolase
MITQSITGESAVQKVAPGVWKIRLGTPDAITPATVREEPSRPIVGEGGLSDVDVCPVAADAIRHQVRARGVTVEIAIADRNGPEAFFGLGLQLGRVNQTGRKRTLRVNSDPVGDAGDSHAPVPFVVSTAGYAVLVDTNRYATFYLGSHAKVDRESAAVQASADAQGHVAATSTEEIYTTRAVVRRQLVVDVPAAQGLDIYVFAGPTAMQAVRRYNLYSGGGCLPPMWGLGVWYRAYAQANQEAVLTLAHKLRESGMPVDVLGLEPGWQTKAYSCSFVWNRQNFPDPDKLAADLKAMGFELNLWEHVFVHPTSPMYSQLKEHSGDYEVWGGLAPDLLVPQARRVFADYHRSEFVSRGVSGFKLDECDNSDFIPYGPWSFPESSAFPSGLDGEQQHVLLGLQYQRTINKLYEEANLRTYGSVRSSSSFAAPLPYVLYSDLYDHRDFIRGMLTVGFSGLLWTPEVRHATSQEDLLRRIQSVIFSPQAQINAWYIKNPPWMQFDRKKNNADELLEDADELQAAVRVLLRLRMALLPYIYAAFARYCFEGIPPFRALSLDWPDDPETHDLSDQFMMGDDVLVAPVFAGQTERMVYLPAGQWYDFFTHAKYDGARKHTIPVGRDTMLLFVRAGAILPVAEPVDHVRPDTVFEITARAYANGNQPLRPAMLHEDDGLTFDYRRGAFNRVEIREDGTLTRTGNYPKERYRLVKFERVG